MVDCRREVENVFGSLQNEFILIRDILLWKEPVYSFFVFCVLNLLGSYCTAGFFRYNVCCIVICVLLLCLSLGVLPKIKLDTAVQRGKTSAEEKRRFEEITLSYQRFCTVIAPVLKYAEPHWGELKKLFHSCLSYFLQLHFLISVPLGGLLVQILLVGMIHFLSVSLWIVFLCSLWMPWNYHGIQRIIYDILEQLYSHENTYNELLTSRGKYKAAKDKTESSSKSTNTVPNSLINKKGIKRVLPEREIEPRGLRTESRTIINKIQAQKADSLPPKRAIKASNAERITTGKKHPLNDISSKEMTVPSLPPKQAERITTGKSHPLNDSSKEMTVPSLPPKQAERITTGKSHPLNDISSKEMTVPSLPPKQAERITTGKSHPLNDISSEQMTVPSLPPKQAERITTGKSYPLNNISSKEMTMPSLPPKQAERITTGKSHPLNDISSKEMTMPSLPPKQAERITTGKSHPLNDISSKEMTVPSLPPKQAERITTGKSHPLNDISSEQMTVPSLPPKQVERITTGKSYPLNNISSKEMTMPPLPPKQAERITTGKSHPLNDISSKEMTMPSLPPKQAERITTGKSHPLNDISSKEMTVPSLPPKQAERITTGKSHPLNDISSKEMTVPSLPPKQAERSITDKNHFLYGIVLQQLPTTSASSKEAGNESTLLYDSELIDSISAVAQNEHATISQRAVARLDNTGAIPLPHPYICSDYLMGRCTGAKHCLMYHMKKPYQWIYYYAGKWWMVNDDDNEQLETSFCNPDITDKILSLTLDRNTFGIPTLSFFVDFTSMITIGEIDLPIKRLSTKSQAELPGCLVATKWCWYWQNEHGKFVKYHFNRGDASQELEEQYLTDRATFDFQVAKQKYELYFKKSPMYQKNKRYNTEREVRRRPCFGNTGQSHVRYFKNELQCESAKSIIWKVMEKKKEKQEDKHGYRRVELNRYHKEYRDIESRFMKTMHSRKTPTMRLTIESIDRLENQSLWEKYSSTKSHMIPRSGPDANERLIFHGTTEQSVEGICKTNFDWRMSGTSTGAIYGEGTYFATDSSKSHNYTSPDSKGYCYMFVALVLVGSYTQGKKGLRIPPKTPDNPHGDRFDSCVDNVKNPKIFVIFDKDQCYPAYLVKYST